MYFKFFDLGNGLWLKLSMTVKLRDRFITGVKHWTQESGKPMPLFLNTAITNAPDVMAKGADDSPVRIFLKDGDVQGFSSTQEIVATIQRNGHSRVFHGRWDRQSENGKSVYKFKSWEEKAREPFNQSMTDAVKLALNLDEENGGKRQAKKGKRGRKFTDPLDRKASTTYKLQKQQLACAD